MLSLYEKFGKLAHLYTFDVKKLMKSQVWRHKLYIKAADQMRRTFLTRYENWMSPEAKYIILWEATSLATRSLLICSLKTN